MYLPYLQLKKKRKLLQSSTIATRSASNLLATPKIRPLESFSTIQSITEREWTGQMEGITPYAGQFYPMSIHPVCQWLSTIKGGKSSLRDNNAVCVVHLIKDAGFWDPTGWKMETIKVKCRSTAQTMTNSIRKVHQARTTSLSLSIQIKLRGDLLRTTERQFRWLIMTWRRLKEKV